uniref:Uncharacterized protein n=1 Tax=Oryza nivara TaxID=4536 RepID=A0A0E0J4K5_ORYNI
MRKLPDGSGQLPSLQELVLKRTSLAKIYKGKDARGTSFSIEPKRRRSAAIAVAVDPPPRRRGTASPSSLSNRL